MIYRTFTNKPDQIYDIKNGSLSHLLSLFSDRPFKINVSRPAKKAFGLNSGFSLSAPKKEKTPTSRAVEIEKNVFNTILSLKESDSTTFLLGVGSIRLAEKRIPICGFPVKIDVLPDDEQVLISLQIKEWHFSKALFTFCEEENIEVPPIPLLREDFQLAAFLGQLDEAVIALQKQAKFDADIFISVASFDFHSSKETKTKPRDENISPVKVETEGMFPPTAKKEIDSALGAQKLSFENTDTKVAAIQAVLTDQFLQDKRVLALFDDDLEIEQFICGLPKKLQSTLFPLYKISSRDDLPNLLKSLVDNEGLASEWASEVFEIEERQREIILSYVKSINAFIPGLGISVADLSVELFQNRNTPTLPVSVPDIFNVTARQINDWAVKINEKDELDREIAKLEKKLGNIDSFKNIGADLESNVLQAIDQVQEILADLIAHFAEVKETLGYAIPENLNELPSYKKNVSFIANHPTVPKICFNHSWSPVPDELGKLLTILEFVEQRKKEIENYFRPEVLLENLGELVPRLQMKRQSTLKIFDYRFRQDLNRIKGYLYGHTAIEKDQTFWAKLNAANSLKKRQSDLDRYFDKGMFYFGKMWDKSANRNYSTINAIIDWLSSLERKRILRFIEDKETFHNFVSDPESAFEYNEDDLNKRVDDLDEALKNLRDLLAFDSNHEMMSFREMSLAQIVQMIEGFGERIEAFNTLVKVQEKVRFFNDPMIRDFLELLKKRDDIEKNQYQNVFKHSVKKSIFNAHLAGDPFLNGVSQTDLIASFNALAFKWMNSQQHILHEIDGRAQRLASQKKANMEKIKGFTVIQRELRKNQNLLPVDTFLTRSGEATFFYAPIWIAKPEQLPLLHNLSSHFTVVTNFSSETKVEKLQTQFHNAYVISISEQKKPKKAGGFGIGMGLKPLSAPKSDEENLKLPGFTKKEPEIEYVSVSEDELKRTASILQRIDTLLPKCGVIKVVNTSPDFIDNVEELVNAGQTEPNITQVGKRILSSAGKLIRPNFLVYLAKEAPKQAKPKMGLGFGLAKPKPVEEESPVGSISFDPNKYIGNCLDTIYVFHAKPLDIVGLEKKNIGKLELGSENKLSQFVSSSQESDAWKFVPFKTSAIDGVLSHSESNFEYVLVSGVDSSVDNIASLFYELANTHYKPIFFPSLLLATDPDKAWDVVFQQIEASIPEEVETDTRDYGFQLLDDPSDEPIPVEELMSEDVGAFYQRLNRVYTPPGTFSYAKSKIKQDAFKADHKLLPNIPSYELHDGVLMGDRTEFFQENTRRLRKLIVEVVEKEGPIHWKFLLRTVASYWQIHRIDTNVESVFVKQLEELYKNRKIFVKDGCLFKDADYSFELRNRKEIAELFYPDELPLDEIEAAIIMVLNQQFPLSKDDLFNLASYLLGLPKYVDAEFRMFDLALVHLGEQGIIEEAKSGFVLKQELLPNQKHLQL